MKQGLIELPAVTVAYFRQVGPYGSAIQPLWVKLRDWALPRGLWTPATISYGISHDSPMDTPPEKCRYDAGIQVPGDFKFEDGLLRADLPGGTYASREYVGQADDVCASFGDVLHRVIPQLGRQFDFTRPMFERYVGCVNVEPNGTFNCDICVPVMGDKVDS
jgi:AraC family transcriptional regulator